MALITCKECGNEVSSKAAACPKCGAKPPAKTSIFTWIIGGVVLVIVFQCTQRSGFGDRPTGEVSKEPAVPAVTGVTSSPTTAKAEDLPSATGWDYSTETDVMTSKTVSYAAIRSTNSMSLNFPYKGSNYGNLTIRTSAKNGADVLFEIDKGQTVCRSWDYDCAITVRFDDRPPIKFFGIGPSDGSHNAAFLNQVPRFIAEAKKAKAIKVSLEIYQHGSQVLDFGPLTPLRWPPEKP